jgi:hypothetical protein
MDTILVVISNRKWTTRAVHLACAMARNAGARLVLLHLMEARSPYLLGLEFCVAPPSNDELQAIAEYGMIAEDYGLDITLQRMQYESLTDALVQAAEVTRPNVIFADVSSSVFPFMRRLLLWNVRRQLTGLRCQLYTLDEPEQTDEWVPSVSLKATR